MLGSGKAGSPLKAMTLSGREAPRPHLKRRIAYLEDQALDLVLHDETQKRAYQHLCSTPGIAQTSALRLLAELTLLPEEMEPQRRISKTGNKYLRHARYMPAWVASRHEAHVKAFYDQLIARGKKPLQAIVAVMRK